jgi:FkbM family methyltransferase
MCVEAHAGYIDLLKRNRPNSIICHCAAGEGDEDEVSFYANSRGSLSTLDRDKEEHFRENYGHYFTGFEEQRVRKRRLASLFEEYAIEDIDILSIDIEGYELEALKGIDFGKCRPKVLVIESENLEHEREIDTMLIPNGYSKSIRIVQNIFYLDDAAMERRIKNKKFSFELVHTRHPLDEGEDVIKLAEVDTRSKGPLWGKVIGWVGKKAARMVRVIQGRTWL